MLFSPGGFVYYSHRRYDLRHSHRERSVILTGKKRSCYYHRCYAYVVTFFHCCNSPQRNVVLLTVRTLFSPWKCLSQFSNSQRSVVIFTGSFVILTGGTLFFSPTRRNVNCIRKEELATLSVFMEVRQFALMKRIVKGGRERRKRKMRRDREGEK